MPSKRGSAATAEPPVEEEATSTKRQVPEPGKLVIDEFYKVPYDTDFTETQGMAVEYSTAGEYQGHERLRLLREEFEFIPAPGIEKIAEAMVATMPEFEHLKKRKILFLWSRKNLGRKHPMGKMQIPTGLLAHFTRGYDYVSTYSAEGCREAFLTAAQVEALVYHELRHTGDKDANLIGGDEADSLEPIIVDHDFEGFGPEVERYGFWHPGAKRIEEGGAKRMLAQAKQLRLDDTDAPSTNGNPKTRSSGLRYPAEGG